MEKYVSLKGKLDMAKRSLEIKPVKVSKVAREPLVYKDASDVSDNDSEEPMDDSEQEDIIEIPLGGSAQASKRRHVDDLYGDEDYGAEDDDEQRKLDDSVSSSGDDR